LTRTLEAQKAFWFYPTPQFVITGLSSRTVTKQNNKSGDRYPRSKNGSKGADGMRFIFGVIVGYSMRGNEKRLITVLATTAFIVYIVLPAIMLLALSMDVKKERQSRPPQTRVPAIKGLSYEEAETKLHASNLNIRLLATRYDLPLQPELIIDQVPQPGEEVVYGYPVGVTITSLDSHGHRR
jgi:hypothetical protein